MSFLSKRLESLDDFLTTFTKGAIDDEDAQVIVNFLDKWSSYDVGKADIINEIFDIYFSKKNNGGDKYKQWANSDVVISELFKDIHDTYKSLYNNSDFQKIYQEATGKGELSEYTELEFDEMGEVKEFDPHDTELAEELAVMNKYFFNEYSQYQD